MPDQTLAAVLLAAGAAILVLRAALWRLLVFTARILPSLSARAAAWPVWARAAPFRLRFAAGHPRLHALLIGRLNPASFSGLPLTLLCLAAVYAAALLGGLIDDLREAGGLVLLDAGVNARLVPYRASWLVAGFLWITALGAGPAITGMAAAASALLWSQGRTRLLAPLWTTLAGAEGTTWLGKHLIGRPRPAFLYAVTEASPSFPSGHATAATALIGFLAYVTARSLPSLRQRFEASFWAAVIIGLICLSRVFLSLHYLSDIAAGVLVGSIWLLIGIGAAELSRVARST
jgi:membrane-associated phospholipid phosphatase